MGTNLTPWGNGLEYPDEFAKKKSALLLNLQRGDASAIREYLSKNRQWLSYYYFSKSLLHMVASFGDYPDVLEVLIDLGMDVNTPERRYPWGALLTAVQNDHPRSVQWLLEHGARTTYPFNGYLHDAGALFSVDTGRFEFVQLLVEHGAPVDVLLGNPPRGLLSSALVGEDAEIIAYLKSKGALTDDEINARDTKGKPKRKK